MSTERDTVYEDPTTGLRFPRAFAGWVAMRGVEHHGGADGFSVAYDHDRADATATIYVYDRGLRYLPDGPGSSAARSEVARVRGEIEQLVAWAADIGDASTPTVPVLCHVDGSPIRFLFSTCTWTRFGPRDVTEEDTSVHLTAFRNHFVKIRTTRGLPADEAVTASLVSQVASMIEAASRLPNPLDDRKPPVFRERTAGHAEVRRLFPLEGSGRIAAGCAVTRGCIRRSGLVRVVRAGHVIHAGSVASLRSGRWAIDEAPEGSECGLVLAGYDGMREGDLIESVQVEEVGAGVRGAGGS